MTECKYPEIQVQLVGEDGNAMAIIGRVSQALKQGGVKSEEINHFQLEAMSGDYNNVLLTCMNWVDVL